MSCLKRPTKEIVRRSEPYLDSISIREVYGDRLKYIDQNSLNNFVGTVYNNFIELAKYPQLKHSPSEIHRLLTSPNLVLYTISLQQSIMIGYIIGELMKLEDGRFVLFIAYLYVGSKYRRNGLGSILMDKIIGYARYKSMDAVMLVCDTEDHKVMDFYFTKGFMYDLYLRRYDRYDVLTLNI